MSDDLQRSPRMSRRQVLGAAIAGAGAIAVGEYVITRDGSTAFSGAAADHVLRPQATTIDLGSRAVDTIAYGDALPGRTLRLRQGQPVRIRVDNALNEETSVHWHGVRLDNRADGVPGLTQQPIRAGRSHLYEFTPPDAGTYLFHSHSGLQLDRGLYGALVVEAADEPGRYDHDEVVVLDDWLDGITTNPDEVLAGLRKHGMPMGGMSGMHGSGSSGGMSGMSMGSGSMMHGSVAQLRGPAASGPYRTISGARPGPSHLAGLANLMRAKAVDTGDVAYPLHLVNGRDTTHPWALRVRSGDRVRLRFVNAASDTTYLVFVEGHDLSVTHADGLAIRPVTTQALVLGQGERYDALLEAQGAARIVAVPLGKPGRGVAQLVVDGRAPASGAGQAEPARVLSYADLASTDGARPSAAAPATTRLDLAMGMPYRWTMGGTVFDGAPPIAIPRGAAHRFVMRNATMMPHPMHLHGFSFTATGTKAVKDTIIVPPLFELSVDVMPDRPGRWAFHCHNAYHMGAGMMREVKVV